MFLNEEPGGLFIHFHFNTLQIVVISKATACPDTSGK